ncbi:MAG: flagellar motor protein MotA [Pseudomonadota bacterium]
MTRPSLALYTVIGFAVVVAISGVMLLAGLQKAFESNPIFNALILLTLCVGVAAAIRQLLRIDYSARWMTERMRTAEMKESIPFLLVPLTPLIGSRGPQGSCSALSLRAMIDGVFVRLDDGRDVSRYLMNVLILLGLLGTFWGLLQTVGGIGAVIGGLSLGDGDIKAVFNTFKEGLQKPIAGMGISFSASLFGLAGSLILGFMDLQAGRAQNLFCAELEEILGSKDALSGEVGELTGLRFPISSGGGGYQDAVVHSLTDQLERLQRTLRQQVEMRVAEQMNARTLQEVLVALDTNLKSQAAFLSKMVNFQQEAAPVVERLSTILNSPGVVSVEHHARSIDLSIRDFSRQLAVASEMQTEELRSELRVIARLLAGPGVGRETEVITHQEKSC